jgi:hypothetical protein
LFRRPADDKVRLVAFKVALGKAARARLADEEELAAAIQPKGKNESTG